MRISDWSSDVCSSDLMAGLSFVDLLPAAGGEIAAGLQPTLQRLYRIGLQALLALHDGEANLLAFRQALEALGPDRAEMDEDILAILAADESEALGIVRSEEHTSELQSLMRISYAVFCLKKKTIVPHQ